MSTTPDMGLILPTPNVTLGPLWASEVNQAFTQVDSHDHSPGNGAKVTPAGMLINGDFDFLVQNLLNAKSLGMSPVGAAILSLLGSLQNVGGNLWYVNSSGASMQLTNGSSIVATGTGVITPATPGASPYTILTSDAQKLLVVDTVSGYVFNLPAAAAAQMMVGIKDKTGHAALHNITINPNGSDLIDSVNAPYLIDADFESVLLLSDGSSQWFVL